MSDVPQSKSTRSSVRPMFSTVYWIVPSTLRGR
jgi:hypothetical protein